MDTTSWVVILIQIMAFVPYGLASRRFYFCHRWKKYDYMRPLATGIILDMAAVIIGHLHLNQPPWHSWLFWAHLALAGLGLLGFIALFVYLWSKGKYRRPYNSYALLRPLQYRVLFPAWCLGKLALGVRLYDQF